MDEQYYRNAINAVTSNDKAMWGEYDSDSNEGFEDFARLWEIVNDEDADVSPRTYFEAIDLCLNSFFGTIQDTSPVWRNIMIHYGNAVKSSTGNEDFIEEFEKFLEQNDTAIMEMETFYGLIHLAIESGNLNMATLIFNHNQMWVECWDNLDDIYTENPELAAYYEVLTDISNDFLPKKDESFRKTIRLLYSEFGHLPEMNKLNALYQICQ